MNEICSINKLPKEIVQSLLIEKPEKCNFKKDEDYRDSYALWSTKVELAQQNFSKYGKVD